MPADRLRFRPPAVAPTAAIRWLLLRAFGPAAAALPEPVVGAEAVALARLFEVSPRIAGRNSLSTLTAELGSAAAAELRRDHLLEVGREMRLWELVRAVAAVAAPLGIPLVLLKLAALLAAGAVRPGSRGACDVDLLVPRERARELQEALVAGGWTSSKLPALEHQLPALAAPPGAGGGIVELHLMVLGVRPADAASATLEVLDRAGLLVPVAAAQALPGRCLVPASAVLLAHALVHGLGQHGRAPDSYSPFKMIGDLIDLGLGGGPAAAGEETARLASAWVAKDVTAAEAAAALGLAGRLAAGDDAGVLLTGGMAGGEGELLRHLLAGRLDPAYRAALKLELFSVLPSDRPAPARLARALAGTLFLSRAQVDAIYGRPASRWGYLGRRLARPFDLAVRLVVYGARSLRLPSHILPPR